MMILAVFRSRAHSLDYAERLRQFGVNATTVTAPREVEIGCGLCVRFDANLFLRAQSVLKSRRYTSFKGFYKVEFQNGRTYVSLFRK